MGTPDASYPMDGGNAQIANDKASREYQFIECWVLSVGRCAFFFGNFASPSPESRENSAR